MSQIMNETVESLAGPVPEYSECGSGKDFTIMKQNGTGKEDSSLIQEPDDRKNRIVRYWGRRSESFLAQKRAELHSPMAQRWMDEINRQLFFTRNRWEEGFGETEAPKGGQVCPRIRDSLRILDVGCGSGFFTILLAREGHQVTGVDLTPEMVSTAIQLAGEEGVEARFLQMDAENLDFPDETFDAVISRNLTWTLPHAEKAYREWIRVLKKGGTLLNFDANYGLENSADVSRLPKKHAHHQLGMDLLLENEAIKRQLPISACSRPAWDLETLSAMKLQEFTIDLGISSRIYLEKDEFYNPTPMFMLCTGKG